MIYALATITAYTPDCAGCSGFTASGRIADPAEHLVAADLRYWSVGDRIEVCLDDGPVVFTVADTGGAIRGRWRFDLLVETVEEARTWGVRQVHVSPLDRVEARR